MVRGRLLALVAIIFSAALLMSACAGKPSPTPTPTGEVEIRLAPIHEVSINIAESFPPQVIVAITGGLSDGCTTFHDITTERSGNTIEIEITTERPRDAVCTQVYGYFEKSVNLGSDFSSGESYTVKVNDVTKSFVMP